MTAFEDLVAVLNCWLALEVEDLAQRAMAAESNGSREAGLFYALRRKLNPAHWLLRRYEELSECPLTGVMEFTA